MRHAFVNPSYGVGFLFNRRCTERYARFHVRAYVGVFRTHRCHVALEPFRLAPLARLLETRETSNLAKREVLFRLLVGSSVPDL
jgi:hypothetical protein